MKLGFHSKFLGLAVLGAYALLNTTAIGADHREAPLIREDLTADIADVYAFLNPEDNSRLVLAMTVNGLTVPSENITFEFSPDVRYVFNIDMTGDAVADKKIFVHFTDPAMGPQEFIVELPGISRNFGGQVTLPTEEPVPNDAIIVSGSDDIIAFAGQRDDPFFFDVVGFHRFLAGTGGFDGTDGFAGLNVSAIVLEFPLSTLMSGNENGRGDDDDDDDGDDDDDRKRGRKSSHDEGMSSGMLQIWGSTERRRVTLRLNNQNVIVKHRGCFKQVERMGNPAVNTALIPLALKDAYNVGEPVSDGANFAGPIVASLQSLGTNNENIGILASVAVPDTLKLNVNDPVGYPNGRDLDDDVIDTLLFFIFNQPDPPPSDGVDANDRPFIAEFPYLAPPNQP